MITYLALYTGPNGPISFEFTARNLDDAVEVIGEKAQQHFDDASNWLDLDPDSNTLDQDILDALDEDGWQLALAKEHNGDWDIYNLG